MGNLGTTLAVVLAALGMLPWVADPFVAPKFLLSCLCLWPVLMGLIKRRELHHTDFDAPIVLFVGAAFVSASMSIDPLLSMAGLRQNYAHGLAGIGLFALTFYCSANSGSSVARILRALAVAGVPLSLYAIVQWLGLDPVPLPVQDGRPHSTMGSPVYLGSMLILTTAAAWYSMRKSGKLGAHLWAGAMLLSFFALALTRTRGAWVGVAAGLTLAEAIVRRPSVRTLLIGGGSAVALAGILAVFNFARPSSDAARIQLWLTALDAFKESPIIGHGPDTFYLVLRRFMPDAFTAAMGSTQQTQAHAHNDILQVLSTHGFAGLVPFIWGHVAVVLGLLRLYKRGRTTEAAAVAFAAFGLFLQAKTNPICSPALVGIAVLLGTASGEAPLRRLGAMPRAVTLCLLCGSLALLTAFGVRIVGAEAKQYEAAVAMRSNDLMRVAQAQSDASDWAPWDMEFKTKQVDFLLRLIPVAIPEQRGLFVSKALELTSEAMRQHPKDSFSHEVRASALIVASALAENDAKRGLLLSARSELELAQELAPKFGPLILKRLALASMLKDRKYHERVRSEWDRATALISERGGK